mmetsp:Transcript_7411/g.23257  ORF Transcript_7411/g.23257 Transcript_7411/m.23257 type:complete len:243 (+) Transcript_7411:47-775(+)
MWTGDRRPVLSRREAREVYDAFARAGHHTAGKDAGGGYGGPAVTALQSMASFEDARTVFDYGCGQGKLAELVLSRHPHLHWHGVDQSEEMVLRARLRLQSFGSAAKVDLVPDGDPSKATASLEAGTSDRFVSTYVLDLLSEEDMFAVLDAARRTLHPERGLLLLAGITWGYGDSVLTFLTTCLWTLIYRFRPRIVGGCRPQHLEPYLRQRGWRIVGTVRTLPNGFPWMVSEVVAARPPASKL